MLLFLLCAILLLVWYTRKLTLAGTLTAGGVALSVYSGTGLPGISLLGGFFLLGTAVTQWRHRYKVSAGFAAAGSSRRTAGQVLANGGVAALAGLLAWRMPHLAQTFLCMMGGAFAAAAADTSASELGVLYGKRHLNITTLRPDQRGLDGVVSLEGTLLGAAAAGLMALILWACTGLQMVGPMLLAGTAGNLLDSWMGATLERKGYLSNNGVNACNTLAGALVMALPWQA